jgi:hypothetical protein
VIVARIVAGLAGVFVVLETLMSAIRTFVLPRGDATRLTRAVFVSNRTLFNLRMRRMDSYEDRDRLFALFAPVSLLVLPAVWLVLIGGAYAVLFWALGAVPFSAAASQSGSSLLTLGFNQVYGFWPHLLAFSEAALGLGLLAVLIAYLPTMYGAFQRRETSVTLLEVRASSPPSAANMIQRYYLIHGLDSMAELWPQWETWFADIEESHTSLGAMAFFRSPQPDRSWITAAGAVLDAASFTASTLDIERQPSASICIRAGYVALRGICDFFGMPYDPDPAPTDPISVTRAEYEAVCDRLERVGVPLKPDRDETWAAFQGWRVNYDEPLLALCGLVMAPPAPWSSDRARPFFRPRITRRGRRRATAS